MDKVLKQDSSKCITPSSEPFRKEVYMYQPEGFVKEDEEKTVCRLKTMVSVF
jgi:hypothetical protein